MAVRATTELANEPGTRNGQVSGEQYWRAPEALMSDLTSLGKPSTRAVDGRSGTRPQGWVITWRLAIFRFQEGVMVPKGWTVGALNDLADTVMPPSSSDFTPTGIPLRMGNLYQNTLTDSKSRISSRVF